MPSGDLDSAWTDVDDAATKAMFVRLGVTYFTGRKPKGAREAPRGDSQGDLRPRRNKRNRPDEVLR